MAYVLAEIVIFSVWFTSLTPYTSCRTVFRQHTYMCIAARTARTHIDTNPLVKVSHSPMPYRIYQPTS
jgi:hypothetical protein